MAAAFRREIVAISPVSLCADCPERGTLACPAGSVQVIWARTDFFSLSYTSGEMFA